MRPPFPFSAIVGQDALKRALLLGIIQPGLGGVLIRGTKGLAKSTAVRALAHLLPPIETVAGCPFQRRPDEVIADWPLPEAAIIRRPAPLIELPLGASEDRVLGTLHLEKALRGERACAPGLLAAANRGILYIDEVNLLPDHLVDVLLDAAAAGIHRLERDGLSLVHPARFLLVGTMNPEEGELRPQLLDRFGLVVDAADLADPAERAEAVRRRLAYEADPAGFIAQWLAADRAEADRIVQAQQLLPRVRISDELLQQASQMCLAARVEGLRADLVLCQAALAWAAYQGRTDVEASDLEQVAELALAHRRTPPPEPPPARGARSVERGAPRTPSGVPAFSRAPQGSAGSIVESIAENGSAMLRPPAQVLELSTERGRWAAGERLGPARRTSRQETGRVDWFATIRQSALGQLERGWTGGLLRLHGDDLCYRLEEGASGALLFFVVDASGSMAAWRRMRQTKAAIWALVKQAQRRRDRIALLAFRGASAELFLPPTRNLRRARQVVETLPAGGATPLDEGLAAAGRFVHQQRRRRPGRPIWTVILTDGRGNVGAPLFSRDPQGSAGSTSRGILPTLRFASRLNEHVLVIDTETGYPRLGKAAELAERLGCACIPLEEVA